MKKNKTEAVSNHVYTIGGKLRPDKSIAMKTGWQITTMGSGAEMEPVKVVTIKIGDREELTFTLNYLTVVMKSMFESLKWKKGSNLVKGKDVVL